MKREATRLIWPPWDLVPAAIATQMAYLMSARVCLTRFWVAQAVLLAHGARRVTINIALLGPAGSKRQRANRSALTTRLLPLPPPQMRAGEASVPPRTRWSAPRLAHR